MSVGVPNEPVASPMLSVRGLEVVYADAILALRGVDIDVGTGEVVALLGSNGAGKTTLLRAISGLLRYNNGRIRAGSVTFCGEEIHRMGAPGIVRMGMAQVMEGRRIFAELSVEDNLRTGAIAARGRTRAKASFEAVMELFPVLRDRLASPAGYLSGGEQQMVAIGRALMASPKLLLLDEPSLGLAPMMVERIRDGIAAINTSLGMTVLLIEQNASMALSAANHAFVLDTGLIVRSDTSDSMLDATAVQELFLGTGVNGRRTFRSLRDEYRAARVGGGRESQGLGGRGG